jgi:hypothetical protein
MATYKAVTRIAHGQKDGSRKEYQPGDKVGDLGEEAMQALLEAGSIMETKDYDRLNATQDTEREQSQVEQSLRAENETLQQQVAKLKSELAVEKAKSGSQTSTPQK